MIELISKWAANSGVPLLLPKQFLALTNDDDFQTNVCLDYGKFIKRVPFFLLRPSNLSQLIASVVFLDQQSIPYKVRGAAHSSGGQVLTDSGAVIDLSGMTKILQDQPGDNQIRVEGGIWWLHLAEHLQAQGRRPLVMTDNLRTTVAGTLSVGGFGDTTHLYGLQIGSVTELTVVTPDGKLHRLKPSDKLFRYMLAGRGQLGIIAEAKLKTIQRSSQLHLRMVKWKSIEYYVDDAIRIIQKKAYEFCRMRVQFNSEITNQNEVVGVVGNFQDNFSMGDHYSQVLQHAEIFRYEKLDFFKDRSHDKAGIWKLCSPSVEIIFPLPNGLPIWRQINKQILASGLFRYLPKGSSILVLQNDRKFPLAPLPDSEFCLLIALRPAMNLPLVQQYLPLLQSIQEQALTVGAKIYLMSIEPEVPNFLEMQFGTALQEFLALKNELDPHRLLNPGLIP